MNEGQLVLASRADLVTALLGQRPMDSRGISFRDAYALDLDHVGLLYGNDEAEYPAAIVVKPEEMSDFFAWLETYAPQFSPITQNQRIISPKLVDLYIRGRTSRRDERLIRALSGVVVGEVIAQTSSVAMKSLETATLSHALATFSLCFARAQLLHGHGADCRAEVRDGLGLISRIGLISERLVSVGDVVFFWNLAFRSIAGDRRHSEWSDVLGQAVEEISESGLTSSTVVKLARYYEPARELMALQTYSAEDRVKSFDRLIGNIGIATETQALSVEDFCLAYAAVEIGGGSTRHAGLLQEHGERRPLVWLWFGLLASLGNGDKWHPAFARLGNLVQKELRYSFDPWDSPRADIALDELLSLRSSSGKTWSMSSLPRAQVRSLSVELAPGVPFQLSLSAAERKEAPLPHIDLSRLDQAMTELWAFRQSLVQADTARSNSPLSSTSSKASSKRGKQSKVKKDSLF